MIICYFIATAYFLFPFGHTMTVCPNLTLCYLSLRLCMGAY